MYLVFVKKKKTNKKNDKGAGEKAPSGINWGCVSVGKLFFWHFPWHRCELSVFSALRAVREQLRKRVLNFGSSAAQCRRVFAHSNNRSHEQGFLRASVQRYRPKTIKKVDRRERETSCWIQHRAQRMSGWSCEAFLFFCQGKSDARRDFCKGKGFCFHNNRLIHVVHFRTTSALSIRSETSKWHCSLEQKPSEKKNSCNWAWEQTGLGQW